MANRFLTLEEFGKLRNEITLNSLFARDYLNSFEIDPTSVRELFDGYISYREEEIDTEMPENQYYGQWLPLIDNVVDEYDYYKNIACYKDYVGIPLEQTELFEQTE